MQFGVGCFERTNEIEKKRSPQTLITFKNRRAVTKINSFHFSETSSLKFRPLLKLLAAYDGFYL